MSRPTFLQIDLQALQHNYARVRELAPSSQILAMVKANGYGHGMEQVAQALPNADSFGVASIDEGLRLRAAGITQPIFLMEGLFYPDEIALAAEHQFTLIVHHEAGLRMLELADTKLPSFNVWLKINTGMNRLGFAPEVVPAVYQRLLACATVKKSIGLMTHFASADADDLLSAGKQIDRFQQITELLAGLKSLANSAAILRLPKVHADMVRPGLMLYGASPFANRTGDDEGLRPVMTLASRIIAINNVKQGEKVGYGGTWAAPADTRVAVVAAGYGDGYPQFAKSGTPVLVNGVMCETVGRVSMDMLTVDLTNAPEASINDPVILWGSGLPVETVAAYNQLSAYELFTRMTTRPKVEIV